MPEVMVFLPTRLGSSRFPGKPLIDIEGKPLIQRCWESVVSSGLDVYVISQDPVILDRADSFGAKTIMTSCRPQNGTERVAEAANELGLSPGDIVVNCQADQFGWTDPDLLMTPVAQALSPRGIGKIHTVYSPTCDRYDLDSVHSVKVLSKGKEIDFSRGLRQDWKVLGIHYGVYVACKRDFDLYYSLDPTEREKDERLEQLRWPYPIQAYPVKATPWKIDTPEDLMIYKATR